MRMTPGTEESIRCTTSGCNCVCFKPGSVQLRSCDRCGHGWVPHALAKLQFQALPPSSCGPVEVALPGLVFDLSSLVLYGAQAVPVRLKILLDRLYSVLTPEQVGHILHTLGWSLGDYVRGYMLQHPSGKVLDRWLMVTSEEELLILKQFLRFGETRPIVELMTLQCLAAVNHFCDPELSPAPKRSFQSNISAIVERNGGTPEGFRNTRGDSRLVCRFKKNSAVDHKDTVGHFESFPEEPSLLFPFHFPSSALHCLVPPTKELFPPGKLTQCLRKLSGTKPLARQEHGEREEENDPIVQQSKVEPDLKIKADPDKPNTNHPVWQREPRFHDDHELDLHRGMAKQENTSPLSPPLSSSLLPTSSSLRPSISSSPPKISQKLPGSSSFPFKTLPSFSSSFLCPLPTSSIHPHPSSSSSLCPLPSSLCSLPSLSPAGGRKGRVCCGVCGKSFYDKGTLKIHYNAVHLKIKHRCTVAGCSMVFSSLRSRNRHSANPNPRLHTGASRDAHAHRTAYADGHTSETQIHKDVHSTHTRMCKEKDFSDTIWQHDEVAHTLTNGLNSHTNPRHADSPSLNPLPRTLNHGTNQNLTLSTTQTPPPPPPHLLPVCSSSSPGSPPSLVPLVKSERCHHPLSLHTNHTNHSVPAPLLGPAPDSMTSRNSQSREGDRTSPLTNRQQRWKSGDPLPKKKPRKSSMPVKIAREKVEGGTDEEEEETFVE